MVKLYGYFRSSSSYRLRIALNLKGLAYDTVPVNLVAGEQRGEDYRAINPQGLVPLLDTGSERLVQSTAILEWLEEQYPQPPLYPADALARARVRGLCQHIACEIQPLNNLGVLRYLRNTLGEDEDAVNRWYAHWVTRGFESLEAEAPADGFFGADTPAMVEVFLVPQLYNARRFAVDLAPFPRLVAIDERCRGHDAFGRAHPDRQPDAPRDEG
ncbi:MAG: maleylacetoacetate isomerase [Pseudohaliea sp.]